MNHEAIRFRKHLNHFSKVFLSFNNNNNNNNCQIAFQNKSHTHYLSRFSFHHHHLLNYVQGAINNDNNNNHKTSYRM